MASLSSWLRLYCLLKLIGEFSSYVLLAADPEDFRNIAKKVVPENLANKLAQFASDMSNKKNTRDNSEETDYYYESEAEELDEDGKDSSDKIATDTRVRDLRKPGEDVYVKKWKTRVNFDELVERVKDKLTKELSEKLKNHIFNIQEGMSTKSTYNIKKKPNDKHKQREIQKNIIKMSADKASNSGGNYDYNSYETEKTYGYNNLKNKHHPKKDQHIKSYVTAEYQEAEENISPFKMSEAKRQPFLNSKNYYQEENTQDNIEVMMDDETLNSYVINPSKDVKYINKGKQSNYMNHEEDNNLFHLQNHSVAAMYEIEEVPKTNTNFDFNKKFIDNYSDSPNDTIKDESENIQENGESMKHNYGDSLSEQLHSDKNRFVNTDKTKYGFYEEFDLVSKKKNDSYEDYIIPKSENIFASEETVEPSKQNSPRNIKEHTTFKYNTIEKSRFKIQYNKDLNNVKPFENSRQHDEENIKEAGDYGEITDKSQEIKAKTESLWYNYDKQSPKTVKGDRSKTRQVTSEVSSTKKFKGTMIPTREYFKMASPNYYVSLPTVAEKYDPYEPLPEKDRVRKVIKHFVNPPASINKKVRLI